MMHLRELFHRIGGDPLALMREIAALMDKGFVTYDPETMTVELTRSGEFVNAPVMGHC